MEDVKNLCRKAYVEVFYIDGDKDLTVYGRYVDHHGAGTYRINNVNVPTNF